MNNTSTLIKRIIVDGEELVCVAPWYWDEMNKTMEALSEPQPIDVEALKRELFEGGYNRVVRFDVLNALVDDVISRGYLRTPVSRHAERGEGMTHNDLYICRKMVHMADTPHGTSYEYFEKVAPYIDHTALLKQALEALKFYANKDIYVVRVPMTQPDFKMSQPAIDDSGDKARRTIDNIDKEIAG